MARSNKYTVYKHTNTKNGKVYIGITSQSVERRWQNGAGYYRTLFGNAINKYGWDAFTHEILFVNLSKEEACEIEIELIAAYKSNQREYGYNISEGGNLADVIAVRSGEENPRASAVRRINPETGEIVKYKTINAAATEMGINYRGISKACKGLTQKYKGFIWEYADKAVEKRPPVGAGNYDHKGQRKKVKMTEPDGTVHNYDSISEAGESLGIRPNTITRYLRGLRSNSTGRRWSYCL